MPNLIILREQMRLELQNYREKEERSAFYKRFLILKGDSKRVCIVLCLLAAERRKTGVTTQAWEILCLTLIYKKDLFPPDQQNPDSKHSSESFSLEIHLSADETFIRRVLLSFALRSPWCRCRKCGNCGSFHYKSCNVVPGFCFVFFPSEAIGSIWAAAIPVFCYRFIIDFLKKKLLFWFFMHGDRVCKLGYRFEMCKCGSKCHRDASFYGHNGAQNFRCQVRKLLSELCFGYPIC